MLVEEVQPRCVQWLLRQFGHQGLLYEDCEDCFNGAVEGLLKRDSRGVEDPYNYVFTSAKNAALDMLQEGKFFVRYDPDWQKNDDSVKDWNEVTQPKKTTWNPETMLIVAEVALDTEIIELIERDEQLRTLFQATLPKLSPNRRRLVEVLLEHGSNITNATLADIMVLSESAIKSLKSRTFDDLRRLLPTTADELGINFDLLLAPEPEALVRNPVIPSEEGDVDFTL